MSFTEADGGGRKKTQGFEERFSYRGGARLDGIAAAAAPMVVDDPSPPVQLEVAAVQEELAQLLPRALHARFRAGKGDARPLGELLLAQALVLGGDQRLSVRGGKLVDRLPQRKCQPGPGVLFKGGILRAAMVSGSSSTGLRRRSDR